MLVLVSGRTPKKEYLTRQRRNGRRPPFLLFLVKYPCSSIVFVLCQRLCTRMPSGMVLVRSPHHPLFVPENQVSNFFPSGANCRRLLSQWSAPTIRHPLSCLNGHNGIHVHHERWMPTPFYSHLFGTAHAIVVGTHAG